MPVQGTKSKVSLKTVVYGTDFTHCSENAGLFAARMASYFSVPLLVAHAFTPSQAAMQVEMEKGPISQQRKDLDSPVEKSGAAERIFTQS
jgi:hypothetical protein